MDNFPEDENATMSMDEMAREIRALKAALAKRGSGLGLVDADGVKSMLDDCFQKITEAIRPSEIHGSVKDVMDKMSESISAHPLASISIALASGFFIGRALDRLLLGQRRESRGKE
jgi:ElaB/YqjD/DUF883 family membrane-anchored ribosome-binding protein